MIEDARQLLVTKTQIELFERVLRHCEPPPLGVHPLLHKLGREAIEAQLADLREQVAAWEDR